MEIQGLTVCLSHVGLWFQCLFVLFVFLPFYVFLTFFQVEMNHIRLLLLYLSQSKCKLKKLFCIQNM